MTLNAPNDASTMVVPSAEISVSSRWSEELRSIGLYKNPTITSGGETITDEYANGSIKKVKNGDKFTVSFDLHEQHLSILKTVQKGLIDVKNEVASVTGRVETYKPGQWSFDTDILLDKAEADGDMITPTTVQAYISGAWVTLVSGDDYIVGVTTLGKTYIKFVSGSELDLDSPQTASIKVTYSATTDNTQSYIEHSANGIAEGFVTVIQWIWEYNGVKRGINLYLENCLADKGALNPINDADNTTSGYPISLTGTIKRHEFIGFTPVA